MEFINQEELNNMQFHSLEALRAYLEQKKEFYNNSLAPDFEGLSPMQMHRLLREPFSETSPLNFQKADDTIFALMPFFLTIETFLHIIQREGTLKLTAKGNLPLKICAEIADKNYFKEELSSINKLRKEEDFMLIHTAKIIADISGLTRKANGKLNVTKNAQKILAKNDRNALFQVVFQTFMSKFNWCYFDGYNSELVGSVGWAFSLYLIRKYGHEAHPLSFYADKYLAAFPTLVEKTPPRAFGSPLSDAKNAYIVRTFSRYFYWFGFVHYPEKPSFMSRENDIVFKTAVVDEIFLFDV